MPKLRRLNEYHKRAMELKYKGNSYQEIADFLNERFKKSRKTKSGLSFTEQTIKDWFKENGTLCENHRLYEEEMDEVQREAVEVIKKAGVRIREKNFRVANEMLVALMGSDNDSIKLAAIKELLNRVEGQPKQFLDVKKDEEGLLVYEKIIREIEKEKEEQEQAQKQE